VEGQLAELNELSAKLAKAGKELQAAVSIARLETMEFAAWLNQQAPSKTGPSGLGKENYTWSQQHVHLLP